MSLAFVLDFVRGPTRASEATLALLTTYDVASWLKEIAPN